MTAFVAVECPACQSRLRLKSTTQLNRSVVCSRCDQPFWLDDPSSDNSTTSPGADLLSATPRRIRRSTSEPEKAAAPRQPANRKHALFIAVSAAVSLGVVLCLAGFLVLGLPEVDEPIAARNVPPMPQLDNPPELQPPTPPAQPQEPQRQQEQPQQPSPSQLFNLGREALGAFSENSPDFHLTTGMRKSEQGEAKQAMHHFDRAIELNPKMDEAFYHRGRLYGRMRELKAALKDLSTAAELKPDNAEYIKFRGVAQQQNGNPKDAIADFTRALDLLPENHKDRSMVQLLRGIAHGQLMNLAEAIVDIDASVDKVTDKEQQILGLIIRSVCHLQNQNMDAVLADLDRAVELDPGSEAQKKALEVRMRVLEKLGKKELAAADKARLASLNKPMPKTAAKPTFSLQQAKTMFRQKKYKELGGPLYELLKQGNLDKEEQFEARMILGHSWLAVGRGIGKRTILQLAGRTNCLNNSISEYRNALKLNGDAFQAYHHIGLAEFSMDKFPAAIKSITKSLELMPKGHPAEGNLRHNRGSANRKAGRTDAAKADFRRIIQLNFVGVDPRAIGDIRKYVESGQ